MAERRASMGNQAEELAQRYWQAMNAGDFGALRDLYTEDAVQEWPQSGERIVGRERIIAVNENYPGLPKATPRRTVADGDLVVAEITLDYGGQAGVYHAVSILELRDGRIARETDYFGAPFPAPQWRAEWVERT
jgi:ketosteroid isomerase-like protein